MGSYLYVKNPESEFGYTPVPENEYLAAVFRIARTHGLKISDKMILKEFRHLSTNLKKLKKKTNLYIDGTNLFAGQYELFGAKKHLSFSFLVKEIGKIIPVDKIFFYASYMSRPSKRKFNKEKRQLVAAEALFYREVKKTENVTFFKGHRSPSSGKEKGVDVHLSTDIVKDVFLGKCNNVVIMTGDADLIYPLEIVKAFNFTATAVFLPNRFSLEMAYKADKAFVLNFLGRFKSSKKLPNKLKIISIKKPRMINIRGK